MSFAMLYYFVTSVVILITHETISPVNGQNTVIQGCDSGDHLISIVAEIQQLRVELFDKISKEVQGIHELQSASIQEMKSQHEIFNESFRELKSQHDTILTSLQAVDRRLEEHDISTWNQTRNSLEEDDISTRNTIQNSRAFANGSCDPASDVCDCSDIKASGQNRSGVYEVCVGHQLNRTCTSAFCDMETANRASLVFQRRKDGSVNFNRTWAEYRDGFGNADGEFWLGNKMLYLLTSKRSYKLRVDLEDWEGAKRYAEYSTFFISPSSNNYRLTVGGYSGNAGDSLDISSGKQFTTIDADNDENGGNCAQKYGGAWWHCNGCSHASLNGKYHQQGVTVNLGTGIHWNHFHGGYTYSLKATEMKLVPLT